MANEPSAAQRKLFAKMGYAMPDGSFYIRPLPQGKTDLENAIRAVGRGEQGGTSGTSIRKHIMMRAAALKLSNEIPKTWSADGTLKEAAQDGMTVGELMTHFGVKGMHWGVRNAESKAEEGESGSGSKPNKHDKLIQKAEAHEAVAKTHAKLANLYKDEAAEVARKGLNSAAGKRVYGDNAANEGPGLFYIKNNQSKGEAVYQLQNNLRLVHNQYARSSNRHTAKAQKLRDKAAKLEHGGLNFDPNFDVDSYLQHFEIDYDFESVIDKNLRHFGVKGMHWGVRKARGPASEDHEQATQIRGKIKDNGGIHALSNDELKTLNERLNLEANYSRLNPEEVNAGKKAATNILGNVANQQANKYANKAATAAIDHLISEAGKAHASRKRNAPLRVVSVR